MVFGDIERVPHVYLRPNLSCRLITYSGCHMCATLCQPYVKKKENNYWRGLQEFPHTIAAYSSTGKKKNMKWRDPMFPVINPALSEVQCSLELAPCPQRPRLVRSRKRRSGKWCRNCLLPLQNVQEMNKACPASVGRFNL